MQIIFKPETIFFQLYFIQGKRDIAGQLFKKFFFLFKVNITRRNPNCYHTVNLTLIAQCLAHGSFFCISCCHWAFGTADFIGIKSYCTLLFKGALKGKSRSVWQGMIYVAPGAQKTDGYQANRNLILDEHSRADSLPGLEILADDVRCTHGATVGRMEAEPLFYLKSRGIPQAEAEKLVVSDKKMVTGGIKAAYPIMGIDYIKLGEKLDISSNLQIYRVDSFIPRADDFEKTKELIKDSRVATHSNHVCWYAELALEAYKNHRQDWHQALMKIRDIIVSGGPQSAIDEIYSTMASGATEEVTKHIFPDAYIILLPFRWTDIGTWNSLYEFFSKNGEVYQDGKNIVALNSKESIVKCANNKKIIAAYGLEDLVVIDTNDALLIIPKSKADKVGDLLKEVKERGMANFL